MKRPAQYVPLSVRFATGNTGTKLVNEFGAEGLGVWAALLCAAKQNNPPGELTFASDAEFWSHLGLTAARPKFSVDEFLAFMGRAKQTRMSDRRRAGRTRNVRITSWERWHEERDREDARTRKARSRGQSDRDTNRTPPGRPQGHQPNLETETEPERELETSEQAFRSEATPAPALTDITQARPTSSVPGAQRILDQCDVFDVNTRGVIEALCVQLAAWPNIIMLVEDQLLAADSRQIRRSKTALAVRLLQDAVAKVATREIA